MTSRRLRIFIQSLLSIGLSQPLIGFALDISDPRRPIDQLQQTDDQGGVATMRDNIRQEGFFALGASLFSIGRTDLTGRLPMDNIYPGELNAGLSNASGFNEFEQPIKGRFDEQSAENEPAGFKRKSSIERNRTLRTRLSK